MHVPVLGEIIRQRTGKRAHGVVAPVVEDVDRLDIDLKHLPRSCASDRDRSGQDVRPELAWDFLVNGGKGRRHLERRGRHEIGAARDGGDRQPIAAVHGRPRRKPRIEISPVHIIGAGFEMNRHWFWSRRRRLPSQHIFASHPSGREIGCGARFGIATLGQGLVSGFRPKAQNSESAHPVRSAPKPDIGLIGNLGRRNPSCMTF